MPDFFRSIKIQINWFLLALALFLFIKDPRVVFLAGLSKAVFFCVLIESAFSSLRTKKFAITSSAITSGLIIGLVLASQSPWEIFFGASLLAVGLKHLLRFGGRNLLNPAACGIFLTVLLFQGRTEWKGAYETWLMVPAGFYIVYKIRKIPLAASYLVTSLFLFIPPALTQRTPLMDVLGYFNLFFVFIMMIEPKTTPAPKKLQILFGAGIALFIFFLIERGFRYEPELFALLVFNALIPRAHKPQSLRSSVLQQNPPKEPV